MRRGKQKSKQPNHLLRQQRELRGWSQQRVAEHLQARGAAADSKIVGKWERGEVKPRPYYREMLCELYGLTAHQLGFLEVPLARQQPGKTEAISPPNGEHSSAVTQGISALASGSDRSELPTDAARDVTWHTPTPPVIHGLLLSPPSGILVSPSTPLQNLSTELVPVESAVWFGIKIAQLLNLIARWNGQAVYCEQLQEILNREFAMFHRVRSLFSNEEQGLTRREALEALVAIAVLPSTVLTSLQQGRQPLLFAEEFLPQCAASITACWHLMRGSQFPLVEEILSSYLPTLTTLAQQASIYQKAAASLASQGYRMSGILALHRNNLRARELYFQRAVQYSEIAANPNLLAASLISLAYHNQNPTKAAHIYQKALPHVHEIFPLLLSRLYLELAVTCAQQSQKQEGLRYLCLAQEAYPAYPENDPSFLYAEFSPSQMILEEGRTYLALTQYNADRCYPQQARDTFARIEELQSTSIVPERTRVEIINYQAKTALALRDFDMFCDSLEKGVKGAKILGSSKRRQEAIDAYRGARALWPNEPRIKTMVDLFF